MTLLAAAPISLRTLIILVNVVAGVFLLGVTIAAVRERRRRRVTAPNKERFLDDDQMETSRLEHILGWALALFAVVAVSLPVYWLIEPDRQEAMSDQFLETSVEQGAELFATSGSNEVALGCAGCHGPEGQGGVATQIVSIPRDEVEVAEGAIDAQDRVCTSSPDDEGTLLCQVAWQAPSLNDVFQRFSREEVTEILIYGRPGTPMPAWGLAGGGAKNEQSIENIVDFLESIQISSDEAKAKQADLADGRELFQANCARCHTKHWSYVGTFAQSTGFDIFGVPAGGAFGPNLTGDVTLRQFPDIEDHVAFITEGSNFQAPYGTRGIGSGRMPGFGGLLTEAQIRAIVEYERSLGESRVRLDDLVAQPEPTAEGEGSTGDDTTSTTTAEGGEA